MNDLSSLLTRISACRKCEASLPLGPRPVLQVDTGARLMIIGQAPGTRVHKSGIPWDDASGRQLREWLGIDSEIFYNPAKVAIVPMGFCYPGKGKSGDLPPRQECAPLWHDELFKYLPNVELTLLIGRYAQAYYLGGDAKNNLTETVRNYSEYLPTYLPLPHPSPRNRHWFIKNRWFANEVLPALSKRMQKLVI